MLGFGPISSRSISGGPFSLVLVSMAMTATGTMTFAGSANWGAFMRASATGGLTFGGSARWSSYNFVSATGELTFSGSARLLLLGRPIVFYAVPDRVEFTGIGERLTFNVRPDNITFRGMR